MTENKSQIVDVILFGGTSEERLVSVATGHNLAKFLPNALCYFWNVNDTIVEVERRELLDFKQLFLEPFNPSNVKKRMSLDGFCKLARENNFFVFLALHGGRGENGWIQEKFELSNIAFSGSGSTASALCMDKGRAKNLLRNQSSINVPEDILFHSKDLDLKNVREFFKKIGKIVLKPLSEGSSRGLFIIKSSAELETALTEISKSDSEMIAEEFVEGRELTVGVISRGNLYQALTPSEVILEKGATFDYEGKYLGRGSREVTPAEITSEQKKKAQDVALLAHKIFACRGCSRTEIIFNEKGFYFLETNTLPGLTHASFIPQQLAVDGISIPEFLRILRE